MHGFLSHHLNTVGKRVYAAIFLVAILHPCHVCLNHSWSVQGFALHFGLLSASLQSAWLIHRAACSANYRLDSTRQDTGEIT